MSALVQPVKYDYPRTSIRGKAVVVSGGTTGIGRATAIALAAQGANVLVFGRTKQHLEDALGDIESATQGGDVHGIVADQSKRDDVENVLAEAKTRFGGIDILINNAGIPGETVEENGKDWEYVMATNLLGCMWCCEAAIPIMKKRGGGQIVNVGSMSAKSRGAGTDVYVATKTGMRGFTESLSKGVAEDNIRVMLIEPGLVSTDFFDWSREERDRKTSAGKSMKSEDIAECILFALTMPERCHLTMLQVRPSKDTD
jgi:NADP-dependent 3-hydroxy acid dehydrogenase YdfG